MFTRLYYYGTVVLRMSHDEFWASRTGYFLDLLEVHKQYNGISEPERDDTDEIERLFPGETHG